MSFMSCLDSSIVNVALPVMSKKLSVDMASIEWVVASYLIVICSTLLIFGSLGDIKGKINIFKIGIIVFTLGSLLCGISSSLFMLIISRVVQGIGAAAYMANNQGIITQVFSNKERGKALGILASAVALGTMLGPPIGGFIISILNFHYIFLVNVPLGIITIILSLKVFPKQNKICIAEEIDFKGIILSFAGIVIFFSSLIEEQKTGLSYSIVLGFTFAVICFILFIAVEMRLKKPFLQLGIFKNSIFSLSLFCAAISFICLSASAIIIPFYLQDTLKMSASKAGLFMMIQPLVIALVSPLSGTLADKLGAEILSLIGLVLMSSGFFTMTFLKESSSVMFIIFSVCIIALGQGVFQPPNNSLIMCTVPRDKLGIAGSINSLVRNLGQMVGITLSTTILYAFMSSKIGHRVLDYVFGRNDVFIYGMKHVYFYLVVICAVGAAFTIFRLHLNSSRKNSLSK